MANVVTHGACGTSWTQIANRTGHCGGCHRNFSSLKSFDMHQSISDGVLTCHHPTMKGLVFRFDRNVPGCMIWGEEGRYPAPARVHLDSVSSSGDETVTQPTKGTS